jgi:hypothetical protein
LLLDDHSPAMFCYGNIKYEGFKTVLIWIMNVFHCSSIVYSTG